MSRAQKRRQARRKDDARVSVPSMSVFETDPEVVGLRMILDVLQDDGTGRVMHVLGSLIRLADAGEWSTLFGLVAWLLDQTAIGLRNGYGGTEGAIDEVTAVLAAKTLGRES